MSRRFTDNATRRTFFLLIAITTLAGFLRFYGIGDKGLWLDEAFSVWMGWRPLVDLFSWLVRIDQHPPLYYTLLHFWMLQGDSAAQVRALSALFGVLTIPVIFLIGRRMAGTVVGLIAAFILAVSPFHVRFAQEARMYTLLTLNASLAILALTYLLSDPRAATIPLGRQFGRFINEWRARRSATSTLKQLDISVVSTDAAWLGFIIFTVATMLTHNTAVFFPVAVNLYVLSFIALRRMRPSIRLHKDETDLPDFAPPALRNWLLAQCAIFVLWLPWLAPFVIQSIGVYDEFWIPHPTLYTVVAMLRDFLMAFLPSGPMWSLPLFVAAGSLAILGAFSLLRRPALLLFLASLLVVPILGEWLVSLRRPILYDRTLIWTTIPLFLLLACSFRQLKSRFLAAGALTILAVMAALSLGNYYRDFQKEEWREAAAYVAEHVQKDDLIIFNATWVQIPFDYYFRQFEREVAKHGAPVDLFDRGVLEPKMSKEDVPRLRSLIRERQGIWLVYSHDWYTDPQKIIPRTLEEELDLVNRREFFGLEIRQYAARTQP